MKSFFTLLLLVLIASVQKTNATIRTFQFRGVTNAEGLVVGVPVVATIVYDDASSPIFLSDDLGQFHLISFVISVDGNTYTANQPNITINNLVDGVNSSSQIFVSDGAFLQMSLTNDGSVSLPNVNLPSSIHLSDFNLTYIAVFKSSGGIQYFAPIANICGLNPVVTTTADAGAGSLRQAVIDACPGSTITFDPSLNGQTITLTSGELEINKNLTINGPGAGLLTISGNNSSRVFHFGHDFTVTINHLTITGGFINNTIPGSYGAGIYNEGTLVVNNCIISNNNSRSGAGIQNEGKLDLNNSTVSGNIAQIGGGIYHTSGESILTINNSTISGNSATNGEGGAINTGSSTNTVIVINSTIANNTASGGGGGIANNGTVTLTNSTIYNNSAGTRGGGGIYNGDGIGTINILNTIVAGNKANNVLGADIVGPVASPGHNLIGKTDGSSGWDASDLQGTNASPLDPQLASLGDYGGPTETMALLPGSPAIDAGTETGAPTADQRGFSRPVLGTTDIGAFESQGFNLAISGGNNQSAKTGSTFIESLMVSLTANDPNVPVDGAVINFTAPASGASVTLAGNPATITGGAAAIVATANSIVGGPYNVSASVVGTTTVNFNLTNLPNAIATTTVIASSPNPSCSGSVVTFTATITGGGNPVTTGTVSFDDGVNTLASNVPVTSTGQASFSISSLAANSYNIRAVYNGTADFVTSNGSVVHTVAPCCVITCPANITVNNKTLLCGAYVTYPAATTTGNCGALTYSIKSGSWFNVGTTTVKVTNASGSSCSFTVTVKDVQKPVIVCPANITVTASSNTCNKAVSFTVTALDNCSGVTVTSVPASGTTFNVGTTTVTSTATDASGNKTTSTFTVTIKESTPPVITCPASITVNAPTGQCSATVNPGTATATDNCSAPTITGTRSDSKALNAVYPSGVTTITWKAKDASGNTSSCQQKITVKDLQPPVVSNVTVSPAVLWPANHSLQTVTVNYTNTDNCPSCSCQLTVTSNEPTSGTGSGDLSPDWQYVDAHKVKLRAERKSTGAGRTYTITITCTDPSGNKTIKTATVKTPINAPTANRGETETPVVQDLFTTLTAQVVPNPANRTFNLVVNGGNNEAMEIRVFDITGRVVQQLRSAATNMVRFGDNLVQGTYIIELKQGESRVVLKAIKQQ